MNSTSATTKHSTMHFIVDIRSVIGTVLIIFGIYLLLCYGLADGAVEMQKAGGVAANLWSGIAVLVVGVLMWIWAVLNPDGGKSPDTGEHTHLSEEQKVADPFNK